MLGSYWKEKTCGNAYTLSDKLQEDKNRITSLTKQLSSYLSKNLLTIVAKFIRKPISEYSEVQEYLVFSPRFIPNITLEDLKEKLPYIMRFFWHIPGYVPVTKDTHHLWYLTFFSNVEITVPSGIQRSTNYPIDGIGAIGPTETIEPTRLTNLYIHVWRDVPACHEYCRYTVTDENVLMELLLTETKTKCIPS